ncbi:universal stress protein PHOS32-like isoform X1 [Vigna angularis]|uniref:universal stress protein PHOS32-like isoform X1 n=1 Tax=Phaseolus angularis TaxID=3914 RepID=UPI000809E83F|nr:universal stress protein PHOS32-like isoform X1 [Vigna angularis]
MAGSSEKQVVVIGIDDSEQSTYALKWTLDHFFPSPIFKLVLVHSRPTATSAVGLAGPVYVGAAEILPIVDSDLRKIAARVVDSARQLCIDKSVDDVTAEVVEGDPRNVLCDAVEKYHAAVLVVGSHGYGAIKRAVLGSVSDYCAHHAHCTVMIVKKPKIKH